MPRPRKSSTLPIYETKKQAASALGLRDTVPLDELQKLGCVGFAHGRVDLLAVVKWLLTRLVDNEEAPKWRAMKEEYSAKREKIKHDKESKEVADKVATVIGLGTIEAALFQALDRFQYELPPAAKGLTEREIFNVVQKFIDSMKVEARLKFEALARGEQK